MIAERTLLSKNVQVGDVLLRGEGTATRTVLVGRNLSRAYQTRCPGPCLLRHPRQHALNAVRFRAWASAMSSRSSGARLVDNWLRSLRGFMARSSSGRSKQERMDLQRGWGSISLPPRCASPCCRNRCGGRRCGDCAAAAKRRAGAARTRVCPIAGGGDCRRRR